MTLREKVGHLLRRFGLGASQAELDQYEPLGVKGTLDSLLDFERADEQFKISPWEFTLGQDENVNLDPNRFVAWWALRFILTKHPAREKLTVFWHDHFAISASKVESGPAMLQNNETIRKHAAGNFRTLLGAMTKDPAMLRWLDGDLNMKGKPNENFAREVLELFTIGIGNYTEKDIQELARAFTGWGLRTGYRQPGKGGSPRKALMDTLALDLPFVAADYSDGFHDEGPKTILGKTDRFGTDSALDWIVSRPQTARYITKKLWEFYAYPKPDNKIVDRLAKTFISSKYEIKPVLLAIADSPEFWSEKCVRQQVKSPLDFTVSLVRQLELGDRLKTVHEGESMMMGSTGSNGPSRATDMKPIAPALGGIAQLVASQMQRQGMRLFYPPDVSGWEWGEAWVSPAMMTERMRFAQAMVQRGKNVGATEAVRQKLLKEGEPATGDAVVERFAKIFDAQIPLDRRAILIEAVEKAGGPAALRQPQSSALLLQSLARLTFGMPEFQFC